MGRGLECIMLSVDPRPCGRHLTRRSVAANLRGDLAGGRTTPAHDKPERCGARIVRPSMAGVRANRRGGASRRPRVCLPNVVLCVARPMTQTNGAVHHVYVSDLQDMRVAADLARGRVVYLMHEIDDAIAESVCQVLEWLDRQARKEVTIVLSSPGGDVFAGLAIYDAIRRMRSPTRTLAMGYTASMATIILQAGDVREATPNTWLMIHEPQHVFQTEEEASAAKLEDEAILLARLRNQFAGILTERSRLTRRRLQDMWTRKEFWLTAREALKHRLVDAVVGGKP